MLHVRSIHVRHFSRQIFVEIVVNLEIFFFKFSSVKTGQSKKLQQCAFSS